MYRAPAKQDIPEMTTFPTPDPARGLFETLLVLDEEPVALAAHLDRLAASLAKLFGTRLAAGLAEEVGAHARGLRLGRMRIVVDPAGAGATLTTQEVDPADFFPGRDRGVALRSLPCAGGLGAHKWADRGFLAEARGAPVPLLFDAGDEVLEAGRGNLFAAVGEVLRTPALDGRILPGTARAAAIGVARDEGIEVLEECLTRGDLFAADEVFLTGSVRGVEPARSLDGAPLPAGEELSRRVGEALRLKWRTGRLAATGS
jgi:branched-subunit amino acid aminotransferase/4-amino-4-deoxychorismate lyase